MFSSEKWTFQIISMGNPNSKFNPTFQAVFEIIIFFTSESKNAIFFFEKPGIFEKNCKIDICHKKRWLWKSGFFGNILYFQRHEIPKSGFWIKRVSIFEKMTLKTLISQKVGQFFIKDGLGKIENLQKC